MNYKIKALVGDKCAEQNSEKIKEPGAMTITPPFNIGDNTHGKFYFDAYKVYKTIAPKSRIIVSIPDAHEPVDWKGNNAEKDK
jgi:hypothetical protein